MQEKWFIACLMQHANDPATWQSEAIGTWKDMARLMRIYNQQHLNQQITVWQHFLELFDYLSSQEDTFLTTWELDMGKEDLMTKEDLIIIRKIMIMTLGRSLWKIIITWELDMGKEDH